jgi:hypothetical protein
MHDFIHRAVLEHYYIGVYPPCGQLSHTCKGFLLSTTELALKAKDHVVMVR